ncbi:hypothetical protein ACHAXR_007152 [Thalassiosira sp. AJA248-18]
MSPSCIMLHRSCKRQSIIQKCVTRTNWNEGVRSRPHHHHGREQQRALRQHSSSLSSAHHPSHQRLQSQSRLISPPTNNFPSFSISGRRCLVSQPNSASQTSTQQQQPTLFGLPSLLHPSDFGQLANAAIRECDTVRRTLALSLSASNSDNCSSNNSDGVQKAKETLHLLDDISNIVCTVIDAAELCRSVHASPQWRRGATDAFGILSEYIGSLNADERLYLSLRRFVFMDHDGNNSNSGDEDDSTTNMILSQLPPEYQRMAHAMRREFERDGIHLTYTKREEARELNNVIVGLESLFSNNITEKTKFYEIEGQEMVAEVDKVVPRHVLGQLVRNYTSDDGNNKDGSLTLSSDNLLTNTLLAHSPSAALRKEVYMQSHTSIPENLNVLDSLIRHRHLHSSLLGYKSYAHRVLSDRMVGTPEKVQEFLQRMEERSSHVFRRDMEVMLNAKQHVEGRGGGIEPWDVPFYTTLIKAQRQHQRWKEDHGSSSIDSNDDESSQFAGYFTVENSIEGMKVLVQDLFGIAMKEVAIPIEERWDVDTTTNVEQVSVEGGNGGLRKFEFHHEEDGPLGTMYFDLHPRDGKFVHAAHFTIRCGRIRNDNDGIDNTNNDHQLPIVALVCNLSPSSSASQTLLSHSEVETLYHEFGHGLHSLLSRTSFQHLSGTRAAMDFVETPSHLFETFSRDPGFVSRVLAVHYITGLPMSERRAGHLALSHTDFRGVEVQTQIVHSKFDQALFGENPCSTSLGGCTSTEMFERLHKEAGVPYAKGTHWHSRFGHLVTYGAGYYGYLYAQTFAADIWLSTLAPSMASSSEAGAVRVGGTKIWKDMLIHGGAKDPKDMIHAVLGRDPSVDPFFKGMS